MRKLFQERVIRFGRSRQIAQLIFLQFSGAQICIRAIAAARIFANQKLIRVHGGLEVASTEPLAHFRVDLRNRQQRVGNFGRVRGNQINPAKRIDYLLVIFQRAFFRRLVTECRS